MASKGKGKGKTLTKGQGLNKTSTKEFEGAIDSSYYIRAQKQDQTWCDARIIMCRLLQEDDQKKKVASSYEYYVHFIRHNRRMDEWIQTDKIELTANIIEEPPVVKKGQKSAIGQPNADEEYDSTDEITQFQKTIDFVEFGRFKMETWYYSPFPSGYQKVDCLYFCEFCLSFYLKRSELKRHVEKCTLNHPPGNEVYRDDNREISISMYEVDGAKNPIYCENLGYLSKLFLDHKNLYFNLEPFLFFVLCENDQNGSHIVGYFSKQKESEKEGWNLNCILTLPCYQRKGYGKFLISFSYELSLIEGKLGTPETPLSDLGRQTYLSWWTQRIVLYMKTFDEEQPFSIKDIEKTTGIKEKDVLYTLEQTNLIKYAQGKMAICTDRTYLDKLYKEAGRPGAQVISHKIHWVPYHCKPDKQQSVNFVKFDPLNQQ